MKIYAQNPWTLLYLGSDGSWKKNYDEAQSYLSAADAILDCQKRDVEFQIVLKFPDSAYDLVLLEKSPSLQGAERKCR